MTIRTKRRGRTLAAILAAMLMASVLAVVAGGPVQAANTSGEELIDTNGDGVPDSREFAGSHRYNTAVALAQRFAADEGSISTVIIASGESQVDAVTAAGLAGSLNAAVMLTRSNQLPHNVARFIDEHNITDVVVVGGTAAVPDAIVTAIEGLGSRPDVERVSGADRYATAAAIGDRLGGPNPTWCGSTQTAAILVNGGEAGRADAIVAGPLAFRLGLPVLLTDADELPDATSAFLTDNKVERVVVIGGATAVSGGVMNTLVEDVGVVNAQRISGGTAAGTSVAVAKEMLGNCSDVLDTNKDLVALVNREAVADGITSAPVLGRGLGDGGSVPILLVSDDLPAAVSDYLASTAEVRGGQKTHQRILAIGGTAVVSNAVMADAVAAAKTSSDLTATIAAKKYTEGLKKGQYNNVFSVTFSDDVDAASVTDPTLYRVNGRRIEAEDDAADDNEETISVLNLVFTADRTVNVSLSHDLEAGDTVSVVGGGQVAKANNGDLRKLEAASLTLSALASTADRTAPVVEVIAYDGADTFVVYVTEPNMLHNELEGAEWADFVKVDGKGIKVVAPATPDDGFADNERMGVHERFTVSVTPALGVGDVITIERKAFLDKGGRGNALRRHTVGASKAAGKFEISSVSIGDNVHTAQATAIFGGADSTLTVAAEATGIAAGAAGNGWVIYGYDDRADTDSSTLVFDIDVAVDTANQVISYTISDVVPNKEGREATLADLAGALVSNSTFAANFSVDYGDRAVQTKETLLGATAPAGVHFGDIGTEEVRGMTAVGIVVRFNDVVQSLAGVNGDTLANALRPATSTVAGTVSFLQPDNEVHISYTSDSMLALPARSGFRVIPAGVARNYANTAVAPAAPDTTGVTSIREILNSLRPDKSVKP